MSPTAKAFKERSVRAAEPANKFIKVGVVDDKIRVTWLCGGSRSFTPEDLKDAMGYMDGLGTQYGAWFHLEDSLDEMYHTRLKEGRLTANDHYGTNGFVNWTDLRPVLEEALQHVEASKES